MRITECEGGKIAIDTPYNPNFVKKIKVTGGRWDGERRVWVTDARNIEAVRSIMREVYGRDDGPEVDLVTIKVTVTGEIYAGRGPVVLFGRTIASATGRDSGARVGDKVAFIQGGPRSGGSVKNWATEVRPEAVILIHDVPRQAVVDELDWKNSYGTYEIVEAARPDKQALLDERARLLKRVTEIEKALADLCHTCSE